MIRVVCVSFILILTACSSAPKVEAEKSAPEPWDSMPSPSATPPRSAPSVTSDEKPAPPSDDPWADLTAAIKSQSDERIRHAAEHILTRVPADERALNAMAMISYRKGQFDLANYYLGKALQSHPKKSGLHSNLGLVQMAKGDRKDAIRSFRKALELNGNDGIAAANLGAIYTQEKDYAKAAAVLEMAIRRGPRDAKTLGNYAIAMAATGKPDRAEDAYEDALKESPNSRELLLGYAILLVDHLDKPKEGLDIINRLKFIGPPSESRDRLSHLENKAKAGVK